MTILPTREQPTIDSRIGEAHACLESARRSDSSKHAKTSEHIAMLVDFLFLILSLIYAKRQHWQAQHRESGFRRLPLS